MAKQKITKEDARNKLRRAGISMSANYYILRPDEVSRLVEVADEMGYRKPQNASGSRGRYFFSYLKSNRGE